MAPNDVLLRTRYNSPADFIMNFGWIYSKFFRILLPSINGHARLNENCLRRTRQTSELGGCSSKKPVGRSPRRRRTAFPCRRRDRIPQKQMLYDCHLDCSWGSWAMKWKKSWFA